MAANIEERRIVYNNPKDGTELEGFLCVPNGMLSQSLAMLPSLMVCHAFGGITDFEEDRCRALAKLGFAAFAADVYGKGKRGGSVEECFALLKPFREDRIGLLRNRLLAALNRLKAFEFVDQQKIAVIGYCFGGLCALDLVRINAPNVMVAVSFHGSFTPLPDQQKPEEEKLIQASVLICHGDADTHVPAEQCAAVMAEMRSQMGPITSSSTAQIKNWLIQLVRESVMMSEQQHVHGPQCWSCSEKGLTTRDALGLAID